MKIQKLLYIDRRIIYLVVAIGALIPIIRPIGLPVVPSAPVRGLFDRVEELEPGDVVMLSFDYGPSSEPELNPMSAAIMRHLFMREVKVLVVAIFPLGGVQIAIREVERITNEFDLEYGVDYVNLGYKDGGQAPMKAMGVSIKDVFPADVETTPTEGMPIMDQVRNYDDVDVVITLATGIIGEWWANLVNAQFGVDVAVGCTAVSAPKYYAYLRSGQMIGLLGGLKGASEYEKLLTDAYPEAREIYLDPEEIKRAAMTGMDVQSIVHLIIIAFIIFGNTMYFITRKGQGGK
ncbi:MAG: hypothetical protein ABIJ00_05970 [Candidatus Eisenbacteria bacterium]